MRLGYGVCGAEEGKFSYCTSLLAGFGLQFFCECTPPSSLACAQDHSSPLGGCALDGAV